MPVIIAAPYWIEAEYDADYAGPGGSRYGNYLTARTDLFADIDDDDPTAAFAALAWQIGTGPVMSPPFIHHHPLIVSTVVRLSEWNLQLVAEVELATPTPAVLESLRSPDGAWYRRWRTDAFGYLDGVGDDDIAPPTPRRVAGKADAVETEPWAGGRPYLLNRTQLLVQLPPGAVPKVAKIPHDGPTRELLTLAGESVAALVVALNREVAPILERLT